MNAVNNQINDTQAFFKMYKEILTAALIIITFVVYWVKRYMALVADLDKERTLREEQLGKEKALREEQEKLFEEKLAKQYAIMVSKVNEQLFALMAHGDYDAFRKQMKHILNPRHLTQQEQQRKFVDGYKEE